LKMQKKPKRPAVHRRYGSGPAKMDEEREPTATKTDDQPSKALIKTNASNNRLQPAKAPSRPPQKVTFWPPKVEGTRKGRRLQIKCTLDKSYPNFHFIFDYRYVDEREVHNRQSRETQMSRGTVSTNENAWVILFERTGSNEYFIKSEVGLAEYERLKSKQSEPISVLRGSGERGIATIVTVPSEYNLPGLWCKAKSFYELWIYVPSSCYRKKF